ncbi:MAG: FtsX-like permease family protein [Pseudonocardiaceae bacterium]|nr:FtsX-like permease family protein [Pseudonocardiaceae bacterium]
MSRLAARDLVGLAGSGLRRHPLRAVLSALGIAIGVAAVVAVLGVSRSAQAELAAQLDALGTNLLRVQAGSGIGLGDAVLPASADAAASRVAPVTAVSAVADVDATVRRNELVDAAETGGIAVKAAREDLLGVLGGHVASGRFLDGALGRYPTVVLGHIAALRLGVGPGVTVWLGDQRFLVVGVLDPLPLAADLDRSALVGWEVAQARLGLSGEPTTLYLRAAPSQVGAVRDVLPAQVNPEHPENVAVSRPSDALAAQLAAEDAFTGLLLGLGAVALLVGGVGVANVMVMGVLERRGEIGLHRALGATRAHVRRQFLAEAVLLSALGGAAGVGAGAAITAAYAVTRGVAAVVPVEAVTGGLAVALVVGALAGLVPAVRAARLSPVQALRTAG